MIKLTQTQARAVAVKIRERLFEHREQVRNSLREQFINSDDYKNKLREAHEIAVTTYQASLKLGISLGISVDGRYNSHYIYKEDDIAGIEDVIMDPIISKYVSEHSNFKNIPSEDKLVTDLIFESLTSEGIEDLMNKFIEPYL
jgi:actin-related protein